MRAVSFAVGVILAFFPLARAQSQKGDSPVLVKVDPGKADADGKQVVRIVIDIAPGWHIYANPPANPDKEGVKTEVSVSRSKKIAPADVEYPVGKATEWLQEKFNAYEGQVVIRAALDRSKAGPIELRVRYMACHRGKGICLPTDTKKVTIE